ncbi:hypothetical protein C7974DRAFT_59702 [Boeremia exigua]|uniref:uncharacterized protein n=1 Tax=Boeremia exigua TaxID=749465 RepID=UPI001E8E275E|nr:uncharacterized protein C7974DRAFT_59702 [Boeremia exigua]KAH6615125.1 hypothetical protein C7974DRAFT_59702 [Boeremia exigua]
MDYIAYVENPICELELLENRHRAGHASTQYSTSSESMLLDDNRPEDLQLCYNGYDWTPSRWSTVLTNFTQQPDDVYNATVDTQPYYVSSCYAEESGRAQSPTQDPYGSRIEYCDYVEEPRQAQSPTWCPSVPRIESGTYENGSTMQQSSSGELQRSETILQSPMMLTGVGVQDQDYVFPETASKLSQQLIDFSTIAAQSSTTLWPLHQDISSSQPWSALAQRRTEDLYQPVHYLGQSEHTDETSIPSHYPNGPAQVAPGVTYTQVYACGSKYKDQALSSTDCATSTLSSDSGYRSQSYTPTSVSCNRSTHRSSTPTSSDGRMNRLKIRRSNRKSLEVRRSNRRRFTQESTRRDPSVDAAAVCHSETSSNSRYASDVKTQPNIDSTMVNNAITELEDSSFGERTQVLCVAEDDVTLHEQNCQSRVSVNEIDNRPITEKETEDDRQYQSRNNIDVYDSPGDLNEYSVAFRQFKLWEALQQAEQAETQDCVGDVHGTDSSNAGSLSSTIGSFPSSWGGSTTATNMSTTLSGSESLDRSGIKIGTTIHIGSNSKPLDLICWHAAMGKRCKGQTGRSHEVRRLYNDHSMSKKSSNNHRLNPPCTRCGLIFPDDTRAAEHEEILRSDPSCQRYDAKEVSRRNAVFEGEGITQQTNDKIAKAIKDYKGSKSKESRLPENCDARHFQSWVASNVPLYISNSNISQAEALKELSLWYIYFCVLFPGASVPINPCK